MNKFTAYNDYSDFSFYKPGISDFGIEALLIIQSNGLPILSRYYSAVKFDSDEYLILSAFISSLSTFIQSQNSEQFTDFGIGSSRYYLKFTSDSQIFCLIINEILYRRFTGEVLTSILELSLGELIKPFKSFYNFTKDKVKDIHQMDFIQRFCYQIDKILFFNFKNAVNELSHSTNNETHHHIDNFKIQYTHSNQFTDMHHQLLIKGILGIIVFNEFNEPIVFRNYEHENYELAKSSYFISIASAIKRFAHNSLGFLTDIGLGSKRVLVKQVKNDIVICLIVSEFIYWRITGEILNMYLELSLNDLNKSIDEYIYLFKSSESLTDEEKVLALAEQIDLILLENVKAAFQELN